MQNGQQPLVLGIHSFTPQLNGGAARPWDVSVMWDEDDRLAQAMALAFAAEGLSVGYNEPYPGSKWMHSVKTHADPHGLPHVQIEIRQDLVAKSEDEALWALRLAAAIGGARASGVLD
jgi:predicted N-formylglutamate amidohydrolase